MPTTPSPLRYPGGKTSYSKMLEWIIHNNNLKGCSYSEPFAGGAGAAITLLLNNNVQDIWLNDYDKAIYSFWRAIIDHTDEFIKLISSTRISIAGWKRQKVIYENKPDDILALGFATFYLNRCNRAGILSANPIGGIKQNSKYRINARFKKNKLIQKIKEIANLKDYIHIFNLDALDFITKLNKCKNNMLIYFDPPYYQKGELLYLNHYKHSDHENLSNAINQCKKSWLLSYDDHPEVLSLYSQIPAYKKNLRYSIAKPSQASELIISNLTMPNYLKTI